MINLVPADKNKTTGIYVISNVVDDRIYIGSTGEGFHKRYRKHLSKLLKNEHHSPHLQNFFMKYGKDSLTFEILEIVEVPVGKTKKEIRDLILEREQFYLDWFQCYLPKFGFNCYKDARSPLGLKRSQETRAKISKTRLERGIKHTPESLEKLREANRGTQNRMFGKTHSEEPRKKISLKATGRRHTPETKQKMSASRSGASNPFYGKKMSEEHKARIGSLVRKKVVCKDNAGNIIKTYPSVISTRDDGFDYTSVSKACLGKYSHVTPNRYRGVFWEFEKAENSS